MAGMSETLQDIVDCATNSVWLFSQYLAVADLRGGARDARPPSGPKLLYSHAVFKKNWPNNRLAPPFWVNAPSSGKSWIRYCLGGGGGFTGGGHC